MSHIQIIYNTHNANAGELELNCTTKEENEIFPLEAVGRIEGYKENSERETEIRQDSVLVSICFILARTASQKEQHKQQQLQLGQGQLTNGILLEI